MLSRIHNNTYLLSLLRKCFVIHITATLPRASSGRGNGFSFGINPNVTIIDHKQLLWQIIVAPTLVVGCFQRGMNPRATISVRDKSRSLRINPYATKIQFSSPFWHTQRVRGAVKVSGDFSWILPLYPCHRFPLLLHRLYLFLKLVSSALHIFSLSQDGENQRD